MLREEAPGAQRRGSPLSWMEGERGEDGRSGAEAGGRAVAPAGHRRLRRQPGRARLPAALSAGLGRHSPPRAHRAFVCSLLENRVPAAPSPGRLVQGRAAVSASCSHLPLTPQPQPPGHPGSSPSSRPELVRVAFGRNLGAWECVRDPASRRGSVQGDRVAQRPLTHSRGLQLCSLWSCLQTALICWAWGLGSQLTPMGQLYPSLMVPRCCSLGMSAACCL